MVRMVRRMQRRRQLLRVVMVMRMVLMMMQTGPAASATVVQQRAAVAVERMAVVTVTAVTLVVTAGTGATSGATIGGHLAQPSRSKVDRVTHPTCAAAATDAAVNAGLLLRRLRSVQSVQNAIRPTNAPTHAVVE